MFWAINKFVCWAESCLGRTQARIVPWTATMNIWCRRGCMFFRGMGWHFLILLTPIGEYFFNSDGNRKPFEKEVKKKKIGFGSSYKEPVNHISKVLRTTGRWVFGNLSKGAQPNLNKTEYRVSVKGVSSAYSLPPGQIKNRHDLSHYDDLDRTNS